MATHVLDSNGTNLEYTSLPVGAAVSIISLIGTVGNSLVFYVFGFRFPKSPFNLLITVLAVFDLIVCLLFMPIDVLFVVVSKLLPYRLQLCRLGYVVMDVSSAATSVLLCDIAYTRSRMICSPLKKQVTLRHSKIVIGLATILGSVIGLISFFAAVKVDIPVESGLVLIDCGMGYNDYGSVYIFYYVLMVTLITASVALMSVFYIRIANSLIRRRRVMPQHRVSKMMTNTTELNSNENSSSNFIQEARRRKEAVRRSRTISTVMMMFTVTFCFAITYSPHFITLSMCFVFQTISCNMAAYPFLFRSGYISNVANFVIYGCFSSEFRRELSLLVL